MPKRKFSWSVFGASTLGAVAVGMFPVGAWLWVTRASQIVDPEFRERMVNLWVLLAISLALISVGLYLMPKKHARWLNPIQRCVVLALLVHFILVVVTRLAFVTTRLVEEIRPREPSIQIKSAHEVQVSMAIRKQFADLPIRDPTLVKTVKAEPPKLKQARPQTDDKPVPRAQVQPQPLQMQPVRHQAERSTEQAVKTDPKMQMKPPRLRVRRQKPLKQAEKQPTAKQQPKLSRAAAPRPAADAQWHQQQPKRAQAERRQISPTARPWQVRTMAEASIKPPVEVTVRPVETQLTGARDHVAQSEQQVGSPGSAKPAGSARLVLAATGSPGPSKTLESAPVRAEVQGSSLAASAGPVRSSMAAIVERSAAARTRSLPGMQPEITHLPGGPPAGQAGHGQPGKEPTAGEAAGPPLAGTRLGLAPGAGAGAAGTHRGPGDVAAGILVAPTSGTGGSVAVAAANGGGRRGRELGLSAQGAAAIPATVRDGPEVTGPGGEGAGTTGGSHAATSSEKTAGARQSGAAAGKAYAGRQQTAGPGGSFTGGVQPGGASAGQPGPGKLTSLLASAAGTSSRGPGHGDVAGGDRVGVDVSSPAGAPQIAPALGPVTAWAGKEVTPAMAVGSPGLHAAPVAAGGHGGGQAQQTGQVGSAPAAGLAAPDAIVHLAHAAARPLPPGEVYVPLTPPPIARDLKLEPRGVKPPNWLFQRTEQGRKTVIKAMGGSKKSESAVAAAIKFLAQSQEPDGRWTRFTGNPSPGRNDRTERDMGLTGLATLCFLAVDHTPNKAGPYQQHVRKALDYLLANQKSDGDLRGTGGHMYSHGMASLAVIEAAVMTGDPKYRVAAVKAARFILNAQNAKTGGWRYKPGDHGDTSILGWQVMALYSIEHLGFKMPDKARKGALRWLDSVASRTPHRALAGYTDRIPSPAMAAEAAFSRILLGQKLTQPQQRELGDYLLKFEPGKGKNDLFRRDDFYGWYYTALALMQLQNTAWTTWNKQMQNRLLAIQRKDGALRGSWDPKTKHSRLGGRVYSTAMATLNLQVYYRYLPTYAKPQKR